MGLPRLEIDADVARAHTPPGALYADPAWFRAQCDRVLARSWLPVEAGTPSPRRVRPFSLLPESLGEPLLLSTDAAGETRCLSNVCTHRGSLVVDAEGEAESLRCPYHGRRFALDGKFLSMPRSEGAVGFPTPADDLPRVPLARWGPLSFVSLDPFVSFEAWIAPLRRLSRGDEVARWRADPASARSFEVEASWIAYVDNYLEGFHVPFVHGGLAQELDPGAYDVVPLEAGVLQVGYAAAGGPSLDVPGGPRGAGRRVAAAWLWLFPTTMWNLYPWGLSMNFVEPIGPSRTRVRFASWVRDPALRSKGAGADLDRVEAEDEAVVQRAQKGLASRLYRRGRYMPSEEAGVHRFHRLLAAALDGDPFPPA